MVINKVWSIGRRKFKKANAERKISEFKNCIGSMKYHLTEMILAIESTFLNKVE